MIGVGIDIATQAQRRRGRAPVALVVEGVAGANLSFARASAAAAFDVAGQIQSFAANQPRRAYDPATGALRGMLVEPAATNLNPQSRATVAGWSAFGGTHTDLALNDLGVFAGVRVASNGVTADRLNSPAFTLVAGQLHALRVYYRTGTSTKMRVILRGANAAYAMVNGTIGAMTVNGSAAGAIAVIRDFATPGGARVVELNFTPVTTQTYQIGVGPHSAVSGENITVLGAQIETGAAPTSYIATSGAAATRAAELPVVNGVAGRWDVALTYGSGAAQTLSGVTLGNGWWPSLSETAVRTMTLIPA